MKLVRFSVNFYIYDYLQKYCLNSKVMQDCLYYRTTAYLLLNKEMTTENQMVMCVGFLLCTFSEFLQNR